MDKERKEPNIESVLRSGPLGAEDEHLYQMLLRLSPEERLKLAFEFMDFVYELRLAALGPKKLERLLITDLKVRKDRHQKSC